MRHPFAVFIFSLLSAVGSVHAQGYEPLAGMRLSVPATQTEQLTKLLKGFSETERLQLDEDDLNKQGRTVINIKLQINSETFFHIDNFSDPQKFDLNAYSHAKKSRWEPIWIRLKQKLETSFGSENVVPKTFH